MIRRDIIEINLISLKARKNACEQLVFNTDMKVELSLLNSQIKALELELRKLN